MVELQAIVQLLQEVFRGVILPLRSWSYTVMWLVEQIRIRFMLRVRGNNNIYPWTDQKWNHYDTYI